MKRPDLNPHSATKRRRGSPRGCPAALPGTYLAPGQPQGLPLPSPICRRTPLASGPIPVHGTRGNELPASAPTGVGAALVAAQLPCRGQTWHQGNHKGCPYRARTGHTLAIFGSQTKETAPALRDYAGGSVRHPAACPAMPVSLCARTRPLDAAPATCPDAPRSTPTECGPLQRWLPPRRSQ